MFGAECVYTAQFDEKSCSIIMKLMAETLRVLKVKPYLSMAAEQKTLYSKLCMQKCGHTVQVLPVVGHAQGSVRGGVEGFGDDVGAR